MKDELKAKTLLSSSFIGKCVGRRVLGKKFIFVDVIECDEPNTKVITTNDETIHHGLGDHIRREKALTYGERIDLSKTQVITVLVALSAECLDEKVFY